MIDGSGVECERTRCDVWVSNVPLTMHRGPQLDPTPGEGHAHLPGTRPQTSGCWRSTDPLWTKKKKERKTQGSNTGEASNDIMLKAETDSRWLTSVPACRHPLLQHQTASLCSLMAVSPGNGKGARIKHTLRSQYFLLEGCKVSHVLKGAETEH